MGGRRHAGREPGRFARADPIAQGWTLPRDPDLVLDIQKEAYVVPADGVVDYQYFVMDPGFTEDKWVKASQIIPGSAPVVHHVLCFIQPPGGDRGRIDENGLGFLAAYVPGLRAAPFPEGMAKHVPAGSKLVFQMHYTPVGNEQADLSKIGFIFAKPEELTHMVQTVSTGNRGINIPPHAEDYTREATMAAYKHPLTILSYSPHMHVRGKAFSYEAIYPDGQRRRCSTSRTTISTGRPTTSWPRPRLCRPGRAFTAWPTGTIRRTTWPILILRPR